MTFRDGYVHLIDPYQVRHNTNYSTFTVDEFKLKKQVRDLIRRFRDAVALEFDGTDIDSAFSNKVLDQLDITSPFFKRKEIIATFDDIPTLMRYIKEHDCDRDSEGLVLTDQNGFMFKVKYAYYREVKRLRGLHENAIKSLRTSTAIKLNKAFTDVQVRFLNWLRDKDNAYIFETHIIDIFRDFEKDCGKQF